MASVFVSYSHGDAEFAHQLSQDLRLAGHQPWLDTLQIEPGDNVLERIEKGLQGSRYAVIVLSKSAVESTWVDAEWKAAFMDVAERRRVALVPVLKEVCEIPYLLRGIRYADFTGSYAVGFAALAMKLRSPFLTPRFREDSIPINFVNAIEHAARTHHEDHIRLACLHALWSYRPDRAKPLLEDAARGDLRDIVRDHARTLLDDLS